MKKLQAGKVANNSMWKFLQVFERLLLDAKWKIKDVLTFNII
jgi:hypothetical protein